MSSIVTYKRLQIVSPTPTGDGGLALNSDFQALDDLVVFNQGAWNSSQTYIPNDLVLSGGMYYLCLTGNTDDTPPSGNWSPLGGSSVDLTSNLLRQYKLDQTSGTTASDSSTSGVDLTVSDSTGWADPGYTFDGTRYIEGSDSGLPAVNSSSIATPVTVALRAKFSGTNASFGQYLTFGTNSSGALFTVYNASTNSFGVSHDGDSSGGSWSVPADGSEHTVVACQRGSLVQLWVDALPIALAPSSMSCAVSLTGTMAIGANNNTGTWSAKISNCTIRDLRIWSAWLTQQQIEAYDSGQGA